MLKMHRIGLGKHWPTTCRDFYFSCTHSLRQQSQQCLRNVGNKTVAKQIIQYDISKRNLNAKIILGKKLIMPGCKACAGSGVQSSFDSVLQLLQPVL